MPPLEQGAAAGGQFLKAKGFAQHIVGTVIQQAHHRLGSCPCSQHNYRTTQLLRQAQGGAALQQFCTYQEIG